MLFSICYIISHSLVFAKNEDGGILPQSRRVQRNAAIAKGYAEANKNYQAYSDDLKVLKDLNKQLDNNGQAITDNEQRMAKANEATKNASQRAKDYGKQIATNAKTLTDFKRENEVEKPDQQKQGKWSDGLKSMASAGLSMIGNAFISAGVGMLVQGAFSLLGKGIDAFVHKNENLIAKGQEAKETILEQNQTYKDQKSQLEELQEQYTKYASGVKISGNIIKNATLSDEDFQAFLDTSNQIANLAPSMIDGWDSEGNAILKFGTDTKEANQQISDYIQLQRDVTHLSIRDNLQDEYKGVVKDAEKTGKEISNKKDQKKVWSIPNYIDAEEIITKSKKENSFTVDNKKYNLVTVGRICHQKGFDILIEHMENIVQQNKNVNLYIIGDGPDAPKIKKLVKRKKLQENVFFLGSQKNPFEYMKKMDAFVITSRYEGQGMVILEAKVIGLPIFIPKHLEKYVEGIEGCINIEKDILGAKKIEDKQVDYLNKYNYNIKEKIARLLS